MKLTELLLARFNQPDTILVLSKYPFKDIAASHHGVAVYTQETLTTVAQKTGQKFVVFVQQEYGRGAELHAGDRILVIPVFTDGLKMYGQLTKAIQLFHQIQTIQIHSEFYTSGKLWQMSTAVLFFAALKLMGKHLTYIAHNVMDDFDFLAKHLHKSRSDWRIKLLETLTPWYYKALGGSVSRVLTLDMSVMTALKRHLAAEKLVNVPLWVQPQKALVKTKKSKKPNELTLLVYGFVTPYKGVDWLVEQVVAFNEKSQKQKLKLIIAGGKAPSQQGKPDYETFYQNIANFAAQHAEIVLTGFIPAPRVKNYFAQADVVILPYRGILGSSASLAAGLAHGKPCVMSSDLLPYLSSDDVQLAMQETGVIDKQLIFERTPQSFRALVQRLQSDVELGQLAKFAKKLAVLRSPATRLSIERDLIYSPQAGQNSLQWFYGFAKAKTPALELAAE